MNFKMEYTKYNIVLGKIIKGDEKKVEQNNFMKSSKKKYLAS